MSQAAREPTLFRPLFNELFVDQRSGLLATQIHFHSLRGARCCEVGLLMPRPRVPLHPGPRQPTPHPSEGPGRGDGTSQVPGGSLKHVLEDSVSYLS